MKRYLEKPIIRDLKDAIFPISGAARILPDAGGEHTPMSSFGRIFLALFISFIDLSYQLPKGGVLPGIL